MDSDDDDDDDDDADDYDGYGEWSNKSVNSWSMDLRNERREFFYAFASYPDDKKTYSIDKQFMWGSELLISPVLEQVCTLYCFRSLQLLVIYWG